MLGANSPWRKSSTARRASSIVGSLPAAAILMKSLNRAVRLCTSAASPESAMVSPRTVMRAENARFTSRSTQSEGPTICSMPTRSGSVSVICVSSVEMGSLLMEAPFDVHLQNGFIVSKRIETLVKGASKQDGWFVATRYAKGAACVFDETKYARRAHSAHRISRLLKRFRKRRSRRHSPTGETRAHRRSSAANGRRKARCAG